MGRGSMWKMLRINFLLITLLLSWACSSARATVSYDDKAFIINGKRRILISGSIHYPRSTPQMWPDLIQKAKDGGLDVIQTYVFWNAHEPSPGKYNFEGRYDLVKFVKLVQAAGLYVHLRIGPYICAEWNFGGFPVWLKYVPGMEFRTDNGPFKVAMQGFVSKIVSLMKSEGLFEPQGGPIIMSQIENEYGPVEWTIGAPGKAYTKWAAQMAVGQNTGVPWIMCKQETAPDPIIDSCNGFYCENFRPNRAWKPKMFTELWTGWYTKFGGPIPTRPVEDIAFAVARFVQNNGSFFNYYMYHGGTNFGRTAPGNFIASSYDYDAPIDEYGLLNQPKYGHLRDLHKAIKQCEPALVSSYPTVIWLGKNQEAHVFRSKSGACAAFLANYDPSYSVRVTYQNFPYDLPAWSVSILPDCKTVVYNTAKVNYPSSNVKFTPVTRLNWQSYTEQTPTADDSDTVARNGLWEQIYLTRDNSDYLWYLTDVNIASNEAFLKNGQGAQLTVMSAGHALHVFVNGAYSGLRDVFVVAPAPFHHGNHHHQHLQESSTINFDPHLNNASNASAATALGVIPLLTAGPCLGQQNTNVASVDVEDLFNSNNNNSRSSTRGGGSGIHLWQQQQQQGSNTSNNNNNNFKKPGLILDHNTSTAVAANFLGGGCGIIGSSSSASTSTTTCQDCGNQAKKDCSHRRCRTCCKSRGFDCTTHVKSTWVPASRRRERQLMASVGGGAGAAAGCSTTTQSISSSKKPKLSSQTPTHSHTSTSNTTPPRSFDTAGSGHQDVIFKESLPGQVRAPAVFKCVRVTSVDDGDDDEYAYQAMVRIGGHVFKGFLYDQGVDQGGRDNGYPNISDLHLGGGGGSGHGGGGGRNGASSSAAAPILDPSDVYAVSSAGFLGGSSTYGNPIN